MFSVDLKARSGAAARAAMLGLAAFILSAAAPAPAAHAETVPFWVQRDIDDAKAAKKVRNAYNRTSSKRVARKKLGGYAAATEPKRRKHRGVRVAALGNTYLPPEPPAKSVTGGGVRWVASSGCLDGNLKAIIYQVAANFGPVTVNSTCRSKGHNRAVGGARKSKHLTGDAVDFRIRGNVRGVYAYLRSSGSVGGLKHYGGGLFHIDNGDRRTW